jgi:hypothetical protein
MRPLAAVGVNSLYCTIGPLCLNVLIGLAMAGVDCCLIKVFDKNCRQLVLLTKTPGLMLRVWLLLLLLLLVLDPSRHVRVFGREGAHVLFVKLHDLFHGKVSRYLGGQYGAPNIEIKWIFQRGCALSAWAMGLEWVKQEWSKKPRKMFALIISFSFGKAQGS